MKQKKKTLLLLGSLFIATVVGFIGVNKDYLILRYKLRKEFSYLGVNEQGRPEFEHVKSGIVMILVPGGEIVINEKLNQKDIANIEEDAGLKKRVVKLSPFLMAKYEVSQGVWKKVMGSDRYPQLQNVNQPMIYISYKDCFGDPESFCKKVGLKLPTEYQWEYACRAGTSTRFSFGDWLKPEEANCDFSNIKSRNPFKGEGGLKDKFSSHYSSGEKRHNKLKNIYLPCGSFAPNPWGFHDMHGNVWELCIDTVSPDVSNKVGMGARVGNIKYRIRRGGSYLDPVPYCRSSYRSLFSEDMRSGGNGFRPVYVIE